MFGTGWPASLQDYTVWALGSAGFLSSAGILAVKPSLEINGMVIPSSNPRAWAYLQLAGMIACVQKLLGLQARGQCPEPDPAMNQSKQAPASTNAESQHIRHPCVHLVLHRPLHISRPQTQDHEELQHQRL